jgi:protein phosphatase
VNDSRRSYGFQLAITTATDVGRVRSNNEDASGAAWLEDGSLFVIVCDGMGGHEAGEVASGLAVQVAEDIVTRDPEGEPRARMFEALVEANSVILDEGSRSGTRGMGTTAIAAILRGAEAWVAQVGDSRLYHIRRGHTEWRTSDHTRVQMLVDSGEITEEESRNHPEAGMLTRALGHARMADGRPLEPEVYETPVTLQDTDALVLCSDGLTDLVEDWEIAQLVAGRTGDEASRALIELACDRGGHDNITVAIIIAGNRAAPYDENYVPASWAQQAEPEGGDPTYDDEPAPPPPNPYASAPGAAYAPPAPPPGPPGAQYGGYPPPPAPEAAGGSKTLLIVGVLGLAIVVVVGLLGLLLAAWFFLT